MERCSPTWIVGGENQAQQIEVEWIQPVICGGTVGLRSGGGETKIQNMVGTGVVGETRNWLPITT